MSDVSTSSALPFGAGRSISVAVAAACLAAGLLLPATDSRAEVTWEVFQLTTDSQDNISPHVSGTTYVWKKGGSNGRMVMWSEGDAQPVVISSESREFYPRISGRRVIWESSSQGDSGIILWDDGVLKTLTDNGTDDRTPDISGPATVWPARGSFGLLYNDGEVERIVTAGGSGPDDYPSLAGGVLTWQARVGGTRRCSCCSTTWSIRSPTTTSTITPRRSTRSALPGPAYLRGNTRCSMRCCPGSTAAAAMTSGPAVWD
ncbi:MAG: hypothetical protein FLDDKLPJ_03041 [Phycisphaerae bacterium]|nr:hypothetical protein [Phycisphaerae bacterium]